MNVALAQLAPRPGFLDANLSAAMDCVRSAGAQGARVVVFPELTLIGYPAGDLLLRPWFVQRSLAALDRLAAASGDAGVIVVVGFAEPNATHCGKPLYNSLAVIERGRITHRYRKRLLPTYGVFDEARYFESGDGADPVATIAGTRVGLTICEDIWCDPGVSRPLYACDPVNALAEQRVDWAINVSASPYALGKPQSRPAMYARQARRLKCPLVVVNQAGASDGLIFDGNSCAFDGEGELIGHCREFGDDFLVVSVVGAAGRIETPATGPESLAKAIRYGLRELRVHWGASGYMILEKDHLLHRLASEAVGVDRLRSETLSEGWLRLSSQTKTDLAFGRFDGAADVSPLADLTGTQVFELAQHLGVALPAHPSGDDPIVHAYLADEMEPIEIARKLGMSVEEVQGACRRIDWAERERQRRPVTGFKLTSAGFVGGRTMPAILPEF